MHHPGDIITSSATQGGSGMSPLSWMIIFIIVGIGFIVIYHLTKKKK